MLITTRKNKRKINRFLSDPEKVSKAFERSEERRKREAKKHVEFTRSKGRFLKARIFIGSLFALIGILIYLSYSK